MRLMSYLNRPEYVLRPFQIFRRLMRPVNRQFNEVQEVVLPWGASIRINPNEAIGRSIWTIGIYDLSVTETLWRLTERSEVAIDIGANIGYMVSIMAKRVGEKGKVYCFEPHPDIYKDLSRNVDHWLKTEDYPQITKYQVALSSCSGEGHLRIPPEFHSNKGVAALDLSHKSTSGDRGSNSTSAFISVPLKTFDSYFKVSEKIGVLKIDIEGHETEVFKGAVSFLENRRIRDIIFEEHTPYPNSSIVFLESKGYTVFRISRSFWGPLLRSPREGSRFSREPSNYLATIDPIRATNFLKKRGWYSLSNSNYIFKTLL